MLECITCLLTPWNAFLVWAACLIISQVLNRMISPGFHPQGKHVLITGGSAGLGLALATQYAQQGAKVTIMARSKATLDKAKKSILDAIPQETRNETSVLALSCDVTDFDQVKKCINDANVHHGRVTDHVICAAGLAIPGYFIEQDMQTFRKQMDVNYYGTVHIVKAALPHMLEAQEKDRSSLKDGRFVFVSSGCGYIGFVGFAGYSSTKYALRGFADSLRNELKFYGIEVSIFYPGNMDTPGFEAENCTKPMETKLIEGSSTVVSAESAAKDLINGISKAEYAITNDIGIYFLRVLSNGIAPRSSTVLEIILLPFTVVFQVGFLYFMDFVVKSNKGPRKTKTE